MNCERCIGGTMLTIHGETACIACGWSPSLEAEAAEAEALEVAEWGRRPGAEPRPRSRRKVPA